jgi:tetratricopeptide (TPR) repeat protein
MTVPSVFISYSHKDEIWKDRLLPHLGMLAKAGRLTIWEDRAIDAGATWYNEIKRAMEDAEVAVCLISADYLNSDFCIKEEIPYLLERRKSDGMILIPILIRSCAWKAIDWLKAIQMLPRDGKSIAKDFKDDWDTPFTQVAEQILSIYSKSVILREVVIEPRWSPPEKVNVDRLPVTGRELFGRQNELKLLDEAWESDKINVISFVAWGGVGKSTLINKWREQLAVDNYRGAKRAYAWSFYSQGTGERVTSADLFIAEALKWFGDPKMANSNASPWDKGQRLADLVRSEKTLLLLDGMEPLQSYFEFERGKIKDPALAVLVTELAKDNPGLCVITTRESVIDLNEFSETTQQIDLEQISVEAGRALLRVGGVQGTDAELEQAARDFDLHALALNLLAAYIHEIPGHHISNTSEIPDLDVPLKEGKHPRRVISAFEKRFGESAEVDLLRILGLFSSPAEREEIAVVREAPAILNITEHLQTISDVEWLQLVNKLRHSRLIAPESNHRPNTLDAHPLVREHFSKQLKKEYHHAWREGNNRLYEYYKSVAKELPSTLEEMVPLYAAMMHGCQAEKHQEVLDEVFYKQMDRGKAFIVRNLGAIGSTLASLSGFFNPPWYHPIDTLDENSKPFILNVVSYCLRASGRLIEAAQPLKAALEASVEQQNWMSAAIYSNNLSELYLITGDVLQAFAYAEQSIEFAQSNNDIRWQRVALATLADILHQAGRLEEAQVKFREAEEILKKLQPELPFLYSWSGYRYCDLLLSQGNHVEAQRRAQEALELVLQGSRNLSDIAFNNLSLGRVYLLKSRVEPKHSIVESLIYLNRAIDGLRESGNQDDIPRGLLARIKYYRVTGAFDKAQKDLDEAFTISTRGSMGLHLADCHLEYARLYLAKGENAKAHEHWQIAKDSIEKMGYHRRDKEVQELEEQLK